MPISFDEALNHTDPDAPQEQREASARAIQAGVAANEVYWDSRSPLEALRAQAEGHGVVLRRTDDQEGEAPTGLGAGTADAHVIDSTAEEVTPADPSPGAPAAPATPAAVPAGDANPDPAEALREQLRSAGLTPEA